jgi:hypothetical protein
MTSLAFILGVLPLAIATGAGSGSQKAIGTGVIGGMIAATVLGIYFVPVFFVIVYSFALRNKAPVPALAVPQGGEGGPGGDVDGAELLVPARQADQNGVGQNDAGPNEPDPNGAGPNETSQQPQHGGSAPAASQEPK